MNSSPAGDTRSRQSRRTTVIERKNAMTIGTVKWFNETKGYGFIAPNDGGNDVFVHISAVQNSGLHALNEGDNIGYEIEVDDQRGKSSAVNLQMQ